MGWIWMKDASTAPQASAPSAHDDSDDRAVVIDVISEHCSLIDKVAAELASDPLYDASKHDDLWMVRFLLSHKKNIKAAKHTLLYRDKHKLDERDIRYFPIGPHVPDEAFQRYLAYCGNDAFVVTVPDAKLGVVGFFSAASVDMHGLVKHVDEADWVPSFIYLAEWCHQWTDYLTRTTGRLTASVRIIDLSGVNFGMLNAECKKRDGSAMKYTEDCYPQMLKSVFICHSPVWVQAVWRILRPLFPKRVVEKTDFISPESNERERNRLLKYISIENLPVRYGGKNETWPQSFALPTKS